MTEISIYYPTQLSPEKVLAKLLEKVREGDQKAIVFVDSSERVDFLNTLLWTYHPSSFLPHGTKEEGFSERQPIWITETEENPNKASILITLDKIIPSSWRSYEKFIIISSALEEEKVIEKTLKKEKREEDILSIHQQDHTGTWQRLSE